MFGGTWPRVRAGDMGGVLVRLSQRPSEPATAWPPDTRHLLPGPVAFYAVLALTIAPLIAAAVVGIQIRSSREAARRPSAAQWAAASDLRALRYSGAERGRLVLGRIRGRLVAGEARQSVIVIGPTQTGKTTGFAIPAILEWDGPVVATSVKTDLLADTLARRSALGARVWVYDPSGATGRRTATWTPLHGCTTWQGAQRTAAWLCAAARQGRAGIEDADFWYASAAKLLGPLLFAAATAKRTIEDAVAWLDGQEEDHVLAMLDLTDVPAAVAAFEATRNRDDRTKSGIYATAETVLQAYADPRVARSARSSGITAARLLDGRRNTLYICAPAHEQQRLRPLFAALVQQIVAAVYERANRSGQPLDPPLLLVLDECANIAPLRDLPTLASTGAGQGIQLVSVFHDMTQVSSAYGRDRAPTILSNHRAKVLLPGIADSTTLDYVARLLGDEEVRLTSETSGGEGRRSTTESTAFRSLAPAHALRQMRPGQGLLVYGHLPPARLELRPWFRDRQLRKLAADHARS
jgi:type IV secretion system protein VirD4